MSERSFAIDASAETTSFDERVDAGIAFLRANPSCREVLLWALNRCADERADLYDLEREIAALPNYGNGCPEPFFILDWLVEAGCMDVFDVDANGDIVDAQALLQQGATDDDVDDMMVGYAYRTNEIGRAVAKAASPASRMEKLVSEHPGCESAFSTALSFFTEKHTLGEFSSYLKDAIGEDERAQWGALSSPMVLVNKLAETGAIAYGDHGWQTTAEGRGFITC